MKHLFYNEKQSILETRYIGVLRIEDIIRHYDDIAKFDYLPKQLKVLIDCRGVKIDINIGDINLTKESVKNVLKIFNSMQEVILVDRPDVTAVAMLFKIKNSLVKNYSFDVFCTEDAAKRWLFRIN